MNPKSRPPDNACTIEPAADKIDDTLSLLEARSKNKDFVAGLNTGFYDMDLMTDGLFPSHLTVIAARPSVGKSTLARNIAEFVSVQKKLPVAIFSMTESTHMILTKLICSLGQIDSLNMRMGRFSPNDWRRIQTAADSIKQAPLYIDDSPTQTPEQIRLKALELKAKHKDLALLIVNDLTKISYLADSTDSFERLAGACKELKKLAQELNIPIVALSPLNQRTLPEKRQNRLTYNCLKTPNTTPHINVPPAI